MASSPDLKCYSPEGEYIASFKYGADAAQFLSARPRGTTIRWGHSFVVLSQDDFAESFDAASTIISARIAEKQSVNRAKAEGR